MLASEPEARPPPFQDLQQKKWFDFARSLHLLEICRSYDSTMLHQLNRVLDSPCKLDCLP